MFQVMMRCLGDSKKRSFEGWVLDRASQREVSESRCVFNTEAEIPDIVDRWARLTDSSADWATAGKTYLKGLIDSTLSRDRWENGDPAELEAAKKGFPLLW